MSKTVEDNWLLYDGECPFCSRYVKLVRLRETMNGLRLLDARTKPPELAQAQAAGLDVDEGMVLRWDGVLYAGDACMTRLALMSTPSNLFNRLNAGIFKHPRLSRLLYPVLRGCRNFILMLLGRRKIGAAPTQKNSA